MYTPTKPSGNFPNLLQMCCREPFSQYLERRKSEKGIEWGLMSERAKEVCLLWREGNLQDLLKN